MEILVTDREGIERGLVVRSAYVVISIHDPTKPPARVRPQMGLRGVLTLAFHDAEPLLGGELPVEIKLMAPEQADALWAFLGQHRAQVGALVVHCEGGVSRSPAVAAAVAEAWDLDGRRFWQDYTPNHHVYHTVLDAWERVRATCAARIRPPDPRNSP